MIRTAVIGCEREGLAYAAALSALPDVQVAAVCDRSSRALAAARRRLPVEQAYLRPETLLADESIDAVVVAVQGQGRQAAVRNALRAGKAVLVAGLEGFRSDDLLGLARLTERSGGTIGFGVPLVMTDSFQLFRAQADTSPEACAYVRVVRAEGEGGRSESLVRIMNEESLALWRLLGAEPERAAAVAAGTKEGEGEQAVFATLRFSTGLLAKIDITMAKPGPVRRVTLAGQGRTVILDEGQTGSPVTVCQLQEGRPAAQMRPLTGPSADPVGRTCEQFLAVVAGGARQPDVSVWDAVVAVATTKAMRNSAGMMGAPVLVRSLADAADAGRAPALRVIEGGGKGRTGSAARRKRAQLRLISS